MWKHEYASDEGSEGVGPGRSRVTSKTGATCEQKTDQDARVMALGERLAAPSASKVLAPVRNQHPAWSPEHGPVHPTYLALLHVALGKVCEALPDSLQKQRWDSRL